MGNFIKLKENIIPKEIDLDLINNEIVMYIIESNDNEIKYDYKVNSEKLLNDTYKLGELLDKTIKTRFEHKKLQIKNKYFLDSSKLKENVITNLKKLIEKDIPLNKLSLFIPLYSQIFEELNDASLNESSDLEDCIFNKDYQSFVEIYTNLISSLDKKEIDTSMFVEPLVEFIVLSNGNYLDIQANIILSSKIKEAISTYCKKYGAPFWTNREALDEIPIDNFIKICILIYKFKDIWDSISENDDGYDIIDFKNMCYQLDLIDVYKNYERVYYNEQVKNECIKHIKSNALNIFLECIVSTDAYIRFNFNSIRNIQLINYRIWNKPQEGSMRVYSEIQYESLILGVWDYFYLDYISNGKHKYCDECGKVLIEKGHKSKEETLCNKCYENMRKKIKREWAEKNRMKNKKQN